MRGLPKAAADVGVVIVAAGRGERAGVFGGPKQYRSLAGKPIIRHSVEVFAAHPSVGPIVVVINPDHMPQFTATLGDLAGRVVAVTGGATRQGSVFAGLKALQDLAPHKVLIHDAARPFADTGLIDRIIDGITADEGVIPAIPVSDTLKRSDRGGVIAATVSREGLYAAQTPQGFPFTAIMTAHAKAASAAKSDFTDDAAIGEWAGLTIRLVNGSPDNVKMTWASDIEMAERKFAGAIAFPDVRTGNGYDVHAFETGDHVWLCGLKIPHSKKLSGHSDADVGLHALTDALLAVCGAGDIGTHFPPSDPQWRNASSSIFLERAMEIVRSSGGRIANADITLICETPKIAPWRDQMRDRVANTLKIGIERVSVKATTNERLGFIGREEGIAAIATASVVFSGEVPG